MQRTQIFTDAVLSKIKDASIHALILLERGDFNAFDAAAQKLKGMLQTVVAAYAVGMISTAQHRQIQFVYRTFRKQADATFIQLSQ
ncbi:hypothetical protein [Conchiformibius kuhniae]|uniref:Uncharacterized protein n=1 Tax=Conchiformibius kuhniae TaxID=211502 RepID=A0A8T9MXX3_9NEIS|nr:hypothetical protein [Conchiformibius kuhniae]UOP05318.1 hypothetical protein LVJ77_03730 [Conchiformibius kuhniae]